jgi:nitrate/nitrite-specific signal transduction histidine kinase
MPSQPSATQRLQTRRFTTPRVTLEQIKEEAIIKTHTYTDKVIEDLKEKLDTGFNQLMELLSSTRKVLRSTLPRAALGALENKKGHMNM